MNIGALYGIYFAILIIAFVIFYLVLDIVNALSIAVALLYSSFLGIVVVFLGFIWLSTQNLNTDQSMALSILLIIAFLLPTFLIIFITYMKERACQAKSCQAKMDETPTCTGFCQKESYYQHHPEQQ